MQYTIDIDINKSEALENISISFNTANEGSVKITSYGTEMNFEQFLEFANAVQEVREKFAKLNAHD